MKMLGIYINNNVKKLDNILSWALDKNIYNLYLFTNGIFKEDLSKLVYKIPNNINTIIFLDSESSYNLSRKDLDECLGSKNNISFISDAIRKIYYNDKTIILVNDLIEKDNLDNLVGSNYSIIISSEDSYDFSYKINKDMKSIYISLASLDICDDFILLEEKNDIIIGNHLILKNNLINSEVLFKV